MVKWDLIGALRLGYIKWSCKITKMGSHANYHMVFFISQQSEKKGDREHIKEKLNKE